MVGGEDLSLAEINAAAEVIYENTSPDANIIFGALIDENMGEEVSITVLATGFAGKSFWKTHPFFDCIIADFLTYDTKLYAMLDMREPSVKESQTAASERPPDFYKERRLNTMSPLGADTSVEVRTFARALFPRHSHAAILEYC